MAIDPEKGRIIDSDTREQTLLVRENIKSMPLAADCNFDHIFHSKVDLSPLTMPKEFNS